jgi:NADPH2:quinone reductase
MISAGAVGWKRMRRWEATDFGGVEVLRLVEREVQPPRSGEVLLIVRAAGVNPADYKHLASGDRSKLPLTIGYEVSGVVVAVGPSAQLADGAAVVGDEVIAHPVPAGYASAVTVPGESVFHKPAALGFAEAANLLLVGTTAAEMLHVVDASAGDSIVVHGASGAVGLSALQQARLLGVRVFGTASEASFEIVRKFGATPVRYGPGLEERLRAASPGGFAAALDTVGTDEAIEASLRLVEDRGRIVTIAAFARAKADGFLAIGGPFPDSARFRRTARGHIIQMAAEGHLVVPVARTFALGEARAALELLLQRHPGGKLALIPEG